MTEQEPPKQSLEETAQRLRQAITNSIDLTPTALEATVYGTGNDPVSIPPAEFWQRLAPHTIDFLFAVITTAEEVARLQTVVARLEADAARGGPEEDAH